MSGWENAPPFEYRGESPALRGLRTGPVETSLPMASTVAGRELAGANPRLGIVARS
jgi:hypothetical protein